MFTDESDQRAKWPRDKIKSTVQMVEQFRFLEQGASSMALAAARYPLSFPEVTTVVMSTKNETQADMNFGEVPRSSLTVSELSEISEIQNRLGLVSIPSKQRIKELLSGLKQKYL
jgi:aryl-alcohol dehydrogenase-like predicted oxidoreductase